MIGRPRTIPDPDKATISALIKKIAEVGTNTGAADVLGIPRSHLEAWIRRVPGFHAATVKARDRFIVDRTRDVAELIRAGKSARGACVELGINASWASATRRISRYVDSVLTGAEADRDSA